MLNRIRFDKPVVVWLIPDQPESGVRRIHDVLDGLAALHRYGIDALCQGSKPQREWRDAAAALRQARVSPDPVAVRRARVALREAAKAAGALAGSDPSAVPANAALSEGERNAKGQSSERSARAG